METEEYDTALYDESDYNHPYSEWSDEEKQSFQIKLTLLIQEINDIINDNTPKSND